MRKNPDGARGVEVGPDGSLRRRILDYVARAGGELRSDSGYSLQRLICDALDERPSRVSQALLGLERGGLLEREMDLDRHRCQAIRLVSRRPPPEPSVDTQPERDFAGDVVDRLTAETTRRRADLEAAERELAVLIRRAAEASRRVAELRRVVRQEEPAASPPASRRSPDPRHDDRDSEHVPS